MTISGRPAPPFSPAGLRSGACSRVATVSLISALSTARRALEHLAHACLALRGQGLLRGEDVLALVLDPGLVLVNRQGDHPRAHVGVVVTTELGALALVDAGLGDLEPGLVRVTRRRVGLAAELRDPPRVDHVR